MNALAGKVAITYEDKDSENNPIGLKTKVKPSGIGTGKLKITLRHEPNKKAAGVATGDDGGFSGLAGDVACVPGHGWEPYSLPFAVMVSLLQEYLDDHSRVGPSPCGGFWLCRAVRQHYPMPRPVAFCTRHR